MAEAPARAVITGPLPSSVLQLEPSGTAVAHITVSDDIDAASLRVTVIDAAGAPADAMTSVAGGTISVALPRGGPYTLTVDAGDAELVISDIFAGDVWLLAGQSNMQGAEPAPPESDAVESVRFFSVDRAWKEGREPLHRIWEDRNCVQLRIHPVMYPGTEAGIDAEYERRRGTPAEEEGGVGPGLGLAEELVRRTGTPIGLVPTALGSTGLGLWTKQWADENAGEDDPSGSLFWNLVERGRTLGATAGLAWYQGEADSATWESASTYAERFIAFLNDVRAELGVPGLPAVVVQIASVDESAPPWQEIAKPDTPDNWEQVREQIRLMPQRDSRIAIAVASDLPRYDFCHISATGQRELGRRLAIAARSLAGEVTIPDVERVERVGNNGVRVHLSGINGAFAASPDIATAFQLRRADGTRPAPTAATVAGTTIDLVFAEHVGGDDRLVHGPGMQPHLAGTDELGLPLPCFGPLGVDA